jgi:replicative DNA helicase
VSAQDPAIAPHSLEAEMAVLGAMMLSGVAADAVIGEEGVRPEHFYRSAHCDTFGAMLALHERGEPIDHLTVAAGLRETRRLEAVGGEGAIARLLSNVPNAGHVRRYAQIVRDTARSRALLEATFEIQEAIFRGQPSGETLTIAERVVFDLAISGRRAGVRNIAEIAYTEIERIQQAVAEGRDTSGIAMPFKTLDAKIGGLQPMNLIVIAARPGMGKTVAGLNIAEHAALRLDKVALFVTLEMSESELAQRFLADEGNVPHDLLRRARVNRERDLTQLTKAVTRAAGKKLLVYEGVDLQVAELRAIARKTAVREKRLDLIVVDYLQLLSSGASGRRRGESRTEEVSSFAEGLKNLGRELECPVVALAQLNRQVELRTDKRPLLSDLRESGGIEAAADLVLSLYREDYYNPDSARPGETELTVLKNRHGAVGDTALLTLDGPHMRLRDPGGELAADQR